MHLGKTAANKLLWFIAVLTNFTTDNESIDSALLDHQESSYCRIFWHWFIKGWLFSIWTSRKARGCTSGGWRRGMNLQCFASVCILACSSSSFLQVHQNAKWKSRNNNYRFQIVSGKTTRKNLECRELCTFMFPCIYIHICVLKVIKWNHTPLDKFSENIEEYICLWKKVFVRLLHHSFLNYFYSETAKPHKL